tara:strand:- start:33972 stop:34892 length:921 start_codon:yes stop_codon:yes gene_type:complete
MDRRLIIIIVTIVVATHTLFFVFRAGKDGGKQTSPNSMVQDAPETAPATKEATETIDASEAPYALLSGQSPRDEAMDRHPTTKSDTPPERGAVDPMALPANEIPEGSIKIGLHSGTTKLPAEVAEIAKRGALAASEQRWQEARKAYLDLVEVTPDNALAFANLGVAEFQLGNLVAASGNLKRSLYLNSSIASNWQTLGLIQYEQKDLNLAISSLARAIHEAPREAQARVYLAAVIRDYGWMEAALVELKRAIDIDPKLADAHYNLAVTYLETSPPRIELARRHYYTATDLGAAPSPELEKAFRATE